ncbi:MAG: hypothetical protein R2695_20260 [Acidimicrobiales bacterium]
MNRHQRFDMDESSHPTNDRQRGASLVEYVLVLSLIMLAALAGVSAFGSGVGDSVDGSASRVVAAG